MTSSPNKHFSMEKNNTPGQDYYSHYILCNLDKEGKHY